MSAFGSAVRLWLVGRPAPPPHIAAARDRQAPSLVPSLNPRFPLIDSVRALSALGIVAVHVQGSAGQGTTFDDFWEQLALAVPVFFAISGFLLYRPFAAGQMGQGRRVRVREFYVNRVLRIIPAYWLALTVLALTVGLTAVFSADWWRYYGLVQSYDQSTVTQGLPVAWTLSLEAGLYLFLPLYAVIVARLHARSRDGVATMRREWTALLTTILVCSLLRTGLSAADLNTSAILVLEAITWFALGMGLALLSVGATAREAPWPAVAWAKERPELMWAGAAVIVLAGGIGLFDFNEWQYYVVGGAFAVLMVFPAVFMSDGPRPVKRLLANPTLVWLGVISYGIYLWHAPLLFGLRGGDDSVTAVDGVIGTVAALVLTLAAATVSWYAFERPILRMKRHPRLIGHGPTVTVVQRPAVDEERPAPAAEAALPAGAGPGGRHRA